MKTEMNQLVTILTDQLHVDQIYQWSYNRNGKKLQMLHIHLLPDSGMRFGEAKEICSAIFEQYQDTYFTLYYRNEIQQLIEQGLGRFVLICQPENQIYQSETTERATYHPGIMPEEIAKKCIIYIETEKKKSASFLEGYHFYLDNENYPQAAFMLHQALELLLRTALMLLVGDEKKSHYLINNIAHLKIYDSVLGKLSIKDKDREALKELDQSYSAFRYNQGFQIDKAKLDAVYLILVKAMEWVEQYHIELLEEIKQKLSPEHIAQKKIETLKNKYLLEMKENMNASHRDLIMNALEIYCIPISVMCFAYVHKEREVRNLIQVEQQCEVSHHYYLVVGTVDIPPNPLDLRRKLMELLPETIKVTLIVEMQQTILKQNSNGYGFFQSFLPSAEVWFGSGVVIAADEVTVLPKDWEINQIKRKWNKRLQNAKALCKMYGACEDAGGERALCCAMAIATEQICLGLIHTLLVYSPSIHNVNYLMDFVDLLCPEASAVFHRDQDEYKELFSWLTDAQREFRYSAGVLRQDAELMKLYDLVNSFIQKADEHITKHFAKTETLEVLEG